MHSLSSTALAVLYAMSAVGVIALVVHGWFRRSERSLGRAMLWWFGAACGVGFAVLTRFTMRFPDVRGVKTPTFQHVIRYATLGIGVVFLLFVLSAALPRMLDLLERHGFVQFVGARHVRSSKSGFLTVISFLSIGGVFLSSCALCSVNSIMGGFGADLKRKILSNSAHVIVDVQSPGGFANWQEGLDKVRLALGPTGGSATPVVGGDAMASSSTNTAGALVRGIDTKTISQVIDVAQNIEVGELGYLDAPERLVSLPADAVVGRGPTGEPFFKGPDYSKAGAALDPTVKEFLKPHEKVHPGVVIGRELAKSLHVMLGDEVTFLSPMGELTPLGVMPRSKKFRVAGIFYSGMYEYDATHAYVTMDVAQSFLGLQDRITNIDVRITDPEKVKELRPVIERALAEWKPVAKKGAEVRLRDWMELNKNLFSALKLEKLTTFIILSIAIAVASFCIVCTLLLMVTEKGKEIAIMKALGASNRAIMSIFMLEGVIIGGIGTLFGVGTALAACTGLSWFGVRLDPDVYYIDRLPVNVNGADYAAVALAAMFICTISTIYPARLASNLSPVDGLRHE